MGETITSIITGEPIVFTAGSNLHRIDFEDVSLSNEALGVIRLASESLLANHAPAAGHDKMPMAKAIAIFLDRVYWNDENGELVLCSDLAEKSYCMPIPAAHWSVRAARVLQ